MIMSYGMLNTSLRRSVAFIKSFFLATALALASPSAPLQELKITSNLTDQEVEPTFALTFTLSRPLPAAEGRLAVMIGQMDISNLLTPTGDNDSLSYLPRILPLPAGESPVKVFLVTPSDEWREITQLTLRVKAAAPDSASPGQPGGQMQAAEANAAQTAAAKKYSFTPSLTLGMKSQMAESHFPDSNRPERPTFADMTVQASLKSEMTAGWFSNQM